MDKLHEKYYKIDDSYDPGVALVKLIKLHENYFPATVYTIEILEVIKPSTFTDCKVGTKKTVNATRLMDSI